MFYLLLLFLGARELQVLQQVRVVVVSSNLLVGRGGGKGAGMGPEKQSVGGGGVAGAAGLGEALEARGIGQEGAGGEEGEATARAVSHLCEGTVGWMR